MQGQGLQRAQDLLDVWMAFQNGDGSAELNDSLTKAVAAYKQYANEPLPAELRQQVAFILMALEAVK